MSICCRLPVAIQSNVIDSFYYWVSRMGPRPSRPRPRPRPWPPRLRRLPRCPRRDREETLGMTPDGLETFETHQLLPKCSYFKAMKPYNATDYCCSHNVTTKQQYKTIYSWFILTTITCQNLGIICETLTAKVRVWYLGTLMQCHLNEQ